MIALRPFQLALIEEVEQEIAAGEERILIVSPTGSGKTVMAAEHMRRVRARYQRVLFLAHRREIIDQASRRLTEHGMPLGMHGIIIAGRDRDLRPQATIQVASIDTLQHRHRRGAIELPPADVVIFDEAHRVRGRTREALLRNYPDAVWLGLTATPCRGDGRGLGNIFNVLIEAPQTSELISLGVLVAPKVFAPVYRDIGRGVATSRGDYVTSALSKRMNTDELVGDIVTEWLAHGESRPTVAFSVDVAHAVHIRDRFRQHGIAAEYVSGKTPVSEREQILAELVNGSIKVVANCMVLTEGWDCPPLGCIILARPTKQLGLYRQMTGRGLRPARGKIDCVFLDHAGAVYRHGLPSDDIEWTLTVDRRATNATAVSRARNNAVKIAQCPDCSAILAAQPPCWSCGWMPKPRARDVDFADGELGLVINGQARRIQYDAATRARWHGQLAFIEQARGYKPGWAAHRFKEKFGKYPPWGTSPELTPPSPEVASWVRSRMIAFSKRRPGA
jgi:superfamily II DNA or RNA helicase